MTAHVLAAWFVCHDARMTGRVELPVDAELPSRAEAERLLLPMAIAQVVAETGDDHRVELTTVLLDGSPLD